MPTIDIKGVGPAQFPDGMSVDSIRSFLQRKYSQQAINGQSDILQPVENIAAPYEKTLVEKFGTGISDLLTDTGVISNRYGANQIGENLASIGEFLPGIGDATAGDEFGRALEKGNYGTAAINALGIVPGMGEAAHAIFGGILAKNADLGALKIAKIMDDTGADRNKIWKETGWVNDKGDWKFEIDDSTSSLNMMGVPEVGADPIIEGKLKNTLEHPRAYMNYPEAKDMVTNVSREAGTGSGVMAGGFDGFMGIRGGDDNFKLTALHELQHAIQTKEGFARGGSPDSASYFLKKNKDDALKEYSGKRYQASSALFDMGKYGNAEYIAKLDRLSKSDNVKPSSVTGLSDWYEYVDQIRGKFGVMPKTNAKGRNQWLQSAAAFMKNKNMEELDYYGKILVNDAIADPKHIKSQYKKAEREFKKYEPEFKKYAQEERRFSKLESMSNREKYDRLAGEAESRNVETRIDWTPEQRRATPPWESLDVPEDELIYRK